MNSFSLAKSLNVLFIVSVVVLTAIGSVVLRSVAPLIFSQHLIYLALSFVLFVAFLTIDFDFYPVFSKHLYVISILLLLLPLIIGQVTRGAIRWVPLGSLTIQPSEIVRPFLLIFFASYLTQEELNLQRISKLFLFFLVPFILILVQPSLGVAALTAIGFLGTLLASSIEKKQFLYGLVLVILLLPAIWFILQPYQRERVVTFLDPDRDPLGAGYNSIQSMISVGSGGILGRGLGEGVQTQLAFLPERHTDFIFASTSEELGFVGASLLLIFLFLFFWLLIKILEKPKNPTARAYVAGVFLVLFAQSVIHVGMNMGLLPITGIPLPFVSAGGSSLLGTTIAVAISLRAKRQ